MFAKIPFQLIFATNQIDMRLLLSALTIVVVIASSSNAAAGSSLPDSSSSSESKVMLSLDLKSRHSWRGSLTTSSWNMQPTLEFYGLKNMTIGAWGCYTPNGEYAEVDLYASYSTSHLKISVLDYFSPVPNEQAPNHHLFDFDKKTTGHLVDAVICYTFSRIPVSLTASTILFGNDLNRSGYNRYSTYFEASYSYHISERQKLLLFIGGTPHSSMYYSSANVVNAGLKLTHVADIGSYKLPTSGSIIINPARGNIYFIIGITPF